MSIRALQWAFDQEVFSSPQKFVLVVLANFANEVGRSYPSVSTIAKITGQKEETVTKGLKSLIECGFIEDSGLRYGSTQRVKVWQLPDEVCEIPPKKGVLKSTRKRGYSEDNPPPNPPPNPPEMGDRSLEPVTLEPVRTISVACAPRPSTPRPRHLIEEIPGAKDGRAQAEVFARWKEAFASKFGGAYAFKGAQDGRAVKLLLQTTKLSPAEIVGIAQQAWERVGQFPFDSALSLSGLLSQFNGIRAKLSVNGHGRRPEAREGEERIEVPSL